MRMSKETRLAGDSTEQQEAEKWLVSALSDKLGVNLVKRKWSLPQGNWVEIDGFCNSPAILCEAWTHIGSPKSAQKNKIMTDALKLLFVNKFIIKNRSKRTLILLFADKDAATHFQGKSWMAQCLKRYNIEIEIVNLPKELEDKVLNAQERQYR